jgi:hypothetical protein
VNDIPTHDSNRVFENDEKGNSFNVLIVEDSKKQDIVDNKTKKRINNLAWNY